MKIEAIWQAHTQQRVFRELVEAFSRPGEIRDLADDIGGATALRAVLATLIDAEVTLADPHGQVATTDWPLLQTAPASPEQSRYVVANGRHAPDFQPMLGTLASPEYGATILLQVDQIGDGDTALILSGPGIDGRQTLCLAGLHPDWLARRADWTSGFPLGVDLLLCDARRIAALPRTTQVHTKGVL
jgi:alpha-D-ribose 1-methylphosphonate 5-triphosphate synthase subunit PhnH